MADVNIITAVGTPRTEEECLHEEGLSKHLADQWEHGIREILVAGTMGTMQLLTDDTYQRLLRRAVDIWPGEGKVLAGAGDAGFARTRDRVLFLNTLSIDGVAILAPYFRPFSQEELVTYFWRLADISKAPLYLYDLPQVTGTKLEMETFRQLSQHPNIAGAKVSCDFAFTRRLMDEMDADFRVIVAQPYLVDMLIKFGVSEHLDGMWSIVPKWTVAIRDRACAGEWAEAAENQRLVSEVKDILACYGLSAFTDLMNARGIPGLFAPAPSAPLTEEQRKSLFAEPAISRLIDEDPLPAAAAE